MLTPGIKTGICFWKGLRICQPWQQGQPKPASLSDWERSPLHRLTWLNTAPSAGAGRVYMHECEWPAPWTKSIQVKIVSVSPSVFHIRCAVGVSACAYPGLGEINKARGSQLSHCPAVSLMHHIAVPLKIEGIS